MKEASDKKTNKTVYVDAAAAAPSARPPHARRPPAVVKIYSAARRSGARVGGNYFLIPVRQNLFLIRFEH